MDNTSSGLTERAGLSNGPSIRRSANARPVLPVDAAHSFLPTVIIVHKDDNGYGMKVSGDKPVYVQSVKPGGAAEKAGLNSGDTIIKVNGVNVTHSTHTEVVELIKSSTRVELTVHQRPRNQTMTSPSRPMAVGPPLRQTERITSPLPVDITKQRQMESEREHTLKLMLEKEQCFVDSIRSQLAKGPDPKLSVDMKKAEDHIKILQQQLNQLNAASISNHHHHPHQHHHSHSDVPHHPPPAHLTHHRTKSSPETINTQCLSPAEASRQLIASESISNLSFGPKRSRSTGGGSGWDVDSPRITPPGTPPPPYGGASGETGEPPPTTEEEDEHLHEEVNWNEPGSDMSPLNNVNNNNNNNNNNCVQYTSTVLPQHPIITMEDDEMSDQEVVHLEDHGYFKSISKVVTHQAHLAVFMNFVISNADYSSLLFYLITDLFKAGNGKEMRKWAYEIHSSFLVPGAPLSLRNVDEAIAREIDDVLLNDTDKEEILRKIFWKARGKAKEELNEQLIDFQQKRTAGLGGMFGAADSQLDESIHDKMKEMKIVESILVPIIEQYRDDLEKETITDPKRFTTAAALGTIGAKIFGLRGTHISPLFERCPTFVSKDKSLKARLMGKSRKVTACGHHFVAHQYYTVTYCNHCQTIIGGIGPQGYQCSDCNFNIHRHCVRLIEESCPGPLLKKERTNDRISKFMEKIRPERDLRRKPSPVMNSSHPERMKLSEDESCIPEGDFISGDRPVGRGERRPDPVSEERSGGDSHANEDEHHEITHHVPRKTSSTSINRSESYKERVQKKQTRERRKTSDPNLSKTNDVDVDQQGLSYNTNSGSSSNSSLSTRLESPSNSLEMVSGPRTHEAVTLTITPNSSTTLYDSDIEAEPDPPDWTQGVEEEILTRLSIEEKKRQEVINELFHTERSHVRNLKVLDQVFYRPMLENQILPQDHITLLFPNLEEMLDIHSQFNAGMKNKRKSNTLVEEVSDLLLSMFDGPAGENFQRAAATFCAKQQIALEQLKERRRKDNKLNSFLTDAEGNPLCRRLQLKDIIPTAMQRLTKYPLLFESLARYTSDTTPDEKTGVQRAHNRSKAILNHVNRAVKEAEDMHRLMDIQRRLDKSGFEKTDHPMAGEFKNLDLTKHRLIHEGPLNWRITNRQKMIDLYVLLLEDLIILFQKQDEKYCLKFYNVNSVGGERSATPVLSPIIKVSTVLVRPNAADTRALYLVNTSHNGAQIYDFVAPSSSERKTWFRHISEAAEAYKTRDSKNRRAEAPSPGITQADSESSEDKTKDSEDVGTEAAKDSNDLLPAPDSSSNVPNASHEESSSSTSPPSDGSTIVGSPQTHSPATPDSEAVARKMEKLRRKDDEIKQALLEKRQLVADILNVPQEEFDTISEIAGEITGHKEGTELALAAISHVCHLTSIVNEALRVTEDEAVRRVGKIPTVSAHLLQAPTGALNTLLTQMLKIVKEQEEEKDRLRRELQRLREQVHAMHESQRRHPSPAHSRPNSCISVSSTCEEDSGLRIAPLKDEVEEEAEVDAHDDATADVSAQEFVDALCEEADCNPDLKEGATE